MKSTIGCRRRLAAGTLCLLSIAMSALAALVSMLFGRGSDISLAISVLGTSPAVTLYTLPIQSYRLEILALAMALLTIGLWLVWQPPEVPRWLRVCFLIAVLAVIFAFVSGELLRDVFGIT